MEEALPTGPRRTVAVASLLAGAIHAAVFESHVREWWAHGVFFLIVTLAQLVFGLALATNAIQPQQFGPGYRRAQRALLLAGVVGNLLVALVYVVSRTWGVPVGPEAGEVEPVDLLGVLSVAAECVVIAGSLFLFARLRS